MLKRALSYEYVLCMCGHTYSVCGGQETTLWSWFQGLNFSLQLCVASILPGKASGWPKSVYLKLKIEKIKNRDYSNYFSFIFHL